MGSIADHEETEVIMQCIDYDEAQRVYTLKINQEDLSYIVAVLGGVVSTWHEQDPTILGLTKERMHRLDHDVRSVLHGGVETELSIYRGFSADGCTIKNRSVREQ